MILLLDQIQDFTASALSRPAVAERARDKAPVQRAEKQIADLADMSPSPHPYFLGKHESYITLSQMADLGAERQILVSDCNRKFSVAERDGMRCGVRVCVSSVASRIM